MFRLYGNIHGVYNSLINDDGSRFCMDFNPTDLKYPEELINHCFNREVTFLNKLKNYPWIPENIDVGHSDRKIYFDWFNNTCEDALPESWKTQLKQIAKDLHTEKIYKPSFYPKYFYVDNKEIIHAFTFYSASTYEEQPLNVDFYKPILNDDRLQLVNHLAVNGKLDVKLLVERAFNEYIKWPEEILPQIYKDLFF